MALASILLSYALSPIITGVAPPQNLTRLISIGHQFGRTLNTTIDGLPLQFNSELTDWEWLDEEHADPRVHLTGPSLSLILDSSTERVLGGSGSATAFRNSGRSVRIEADRALLIARSAALFRAAGFSNPAQIFKIEEPSMHSISVRLVESTDGVPFSPRQYGGVIVFGELLGNVEQFYFQQLRCGKAGVRTPQVTSDAAANTMILELGVQTHGAHLTVRETAKLCQWEPVRHVNAMMFRLGDAGNEAAAAHRAMLAYEAFIQAGRDGYWCIVDARSGELVQIAKFPGAYRTSN